MQIQQTVLISFPVETSRYDVVVPIPDLPRDVLEAQVLGAATDALRTAHPDLTDADVTSTVADAQVIWPYTVTMGA